MFQIYSLMGDKETGTPPAKDVINTKVEMVAKVMRIVSLQISPTYKQNLIAKTLQQLMAFTKVEFSAG